MLTKGLLWRAPCYNLHGLAHFVFPGVGATRRSHSTDEETEAREVKWPAQGHIAGKQEPG